MSAHCKQVTVNRLSCRCLWSGSRGQEVQGTYKEYRNSGGLAVPMASHPRNYNET